LAAECLKLGFKLVYLSLEIGIFICKFLVSGLESCNLGVDVADLLEKGILLRVNLIQKLRFRGRNLPVELGLEGRDAFCKVLLGILKSRGLALERGYVALQGVFGLRQGCDGGLDGLDLALIGLCILSGLSASICSCRCPMSAVLAQPVNKATEAVRMAKSLVVGFIFLRVI